MTKKERGGKRTDPVRNEYDTLVYEDKDKTSTLNSFFATVRCLQRSVVGAIQKVDSSFRQIGSDDLAEEYFCGAHTSCLIWKRCT